MAASPVVFALSPAHRWRTNVTTATLSSSSAVPVVFAALAAPSAAPVVPPVPVSSVPATPHSRSLRAVIAPLLPSASPVPAGSRVPSCLAQALPGREDYFALPLYLGASSSPGAALCDALLPYSAVTPLPAAAAGPASGPAEVQRHPWDGDTEVGPGAGPSARLTLPPRRVLSSVGAPSAHSASSRAAPPVAAAATATTATAAADEEEDNPVPVHRRDSCRPCASAAPSAARASTEVIVIDDDDDDEGPRARSARGPRHTPLSGAMCAAVLAAALVLREGSGRYPVRTTRAETFRLPALELTAAKLGEDAEEEVVVEAEEAPGWLPAGVHLSAPDLHEPVEAAGVHLYGR